MTASTRESGRGYRPRIVPLEPLGASWRHAWSRWVVGTSVPVLALVSWIGYRLLALPIATTVSTAGSVEPAVTLTVRAPLRGRISDIAVSAGDTVSPGQVLVRFDDRSLRDQLVDLGYEIAGLRLQERRVASLDLHERSLDAERRDSLQTVEKILRSEASRAVVEREIAESVVRAPIYGVIQTSELSALIGRALNPGDALLDVADPSSWVARLFVSAADIGRIGVGDTVRVTIAPLAHVLDAPITATVRHVAVRPTTREGYPGRFEVLAALTPPSTAVAEALRSGLPAKADIVTGRTKGLTLLDDWIRRKLGGRGDRH